MNEGAQETVKDALIMYEKDIGTIEGGELLDHPCHISFRAWVT
jgi:hypothetical protein